VVKNGAEGGVSNFERDLRGKSDISLFSFAPGLLRAQKKPTKLAKTIYHTYSMSNLADAQTHNSYD